MTACRVCFLPTQPPTSLLGSLAASRAVLAPGTRGRQFCGREGDGLGRCIYCALYFHDYYMSSTSDGQALDPRVWGTLVWCQQGQPRASAEYLLLPLYLGQALWRPTPPPRSSSTGPSIRTSPWENQEGGWIKGTSKRPPEKERREEAAAAPTRYLSVRHILPLCPASGGPSVQRPLKLTSDTHRGVVFTQCPHRA